MSAPLHVAILAAGRGSRMGTSLPKVLHPLAQVPMLRHVVDAARSVAPASIVCVLGHQKDVVSQALSSWAPDVRTVQQGPGKGTGAAAEAAMSALPQSGRLLVLFGDSPLLRQYTIMQMGQMLDAGAACVVQGFRPKRPGRYGLLVEQHGVLRRIVEHADATVEERALALCNGGAMMLDLAHARSHLPAIEPSPATGELYLTDLVARLVEEGHLATICPCDPEEAMGVNTQAELGAAEAAWQRRRRDQMLASGVLMPAPETVHVAYDTEIAPEAIVEPYVVFGMGVTVRAGARVRAFSHIEGATIDGSAVVGPYARLRPGTLIAARARVGNFVEVKAAEIGEGAKVNHLSYIGDARLGAGANVGAGSVTCNYDGLVKHQTDIEAGAFIGSGTMLVAPVRVGSGALTASGSVITSDVPADALGIARARQAIKPGWARRFFARLRQTRGPKTG